MVTRGCQGLDSIWHFLSSKNIIKANLDSCYAPNKLIRTNRVTEAS